MPAPTEQLQPHLGRAKMWSLALLAAVQFMLVIDGSIVTLALPAIQDHLDIGPDALAWVMNAYFIAFGGFMLLGGRLADMAGRLRMFMVGLALFSVASLLGGLATSPGWLFGARALQGLGAALASPAALSLLMTTFAEGPERNRALGVWGAAMGAGGAAGVLLGGVLVDGLGWQSVLFVNVPVGALAIALAPRLLIESRTDGATPALDFPGAVTVTAGLAVLAWGLVDAGGNWGSTATLARLVGGVALLGAFAAIEARTAEPLMPLAIFRRPTLRAATAINLLIFSALSGMFYFLSLYLQQVLGYTAIEAGLLYLPLTFVLVACSGLAGKLAGRIGLAPTIVTGALLLTGGLLWFAGLSADGSFLADVLGPSLLAGAGMGLAGVALTITATSGIRAQESGLASGLLTTSQPIAGALGLAVLVPIAASTAAAHVGSPTSPAALADGFGEAFLVAAGIAAAAALLTVLLLFTRGARAALRPAAAEEEPSHSFVGN